MFNLRPSRGIEIFSFMFKFVLHATHKSCRSYKIQFYFMRLVRSYILMTFVLMESAVISRVWGTNLNSLIIFDIVNTLLIFVVISNLRYCFKLYFPIHISCWSSRKSLACVVIPPTSLYLYWSDLCWFLWPGSGQQCSKFGWSAVQDCASRLYSRGRQGWDTDFVTCGACDSDSCGGRDGTRTLWRAVGVT